MGQYIVYPYKSAIQRIAYNDKDYLAQRQEVYDKMSAKNINSFISQPFKKLMEVNRDLKAIPQSLSKGITSAYNSQHKIKNAVFTGANDATIIQEILDTIDEMKGKNLKTLDEYMQRINTIKQLNDEYNLKFRDSGDDTILSIGKNVYNELVQMIQKNSNVEDIRARVNQVYSDLIGNLGEGYGILVGHNIGKKVVEDIVKSLPKESNVKVTYKIDNAGGDFVNGTRKVGDTSLSVYLNDTTLVGTIGLSNKMTNDYNKLTAGGGVSSHRITLRETSFQNIKLGSQRVHRELLYNLISFHGDEDTHTVEGYYKSLYNTTEDTIEFRRFIAARSMKEALWGVGGDDRVFLLNYGEYLYTMNDLLKTWQGQSASVPYATFPSLQKRQSLLIGHPGMTEAKAEDLISKTTTSIQFAFHRNKINAALG